MATPLPTDFSYENDVSPFTTRLLGSIGSNRDLSASTKLRLQGKLLGGAMEVENQRLELQSNRMQLDLRRLQLQEGTTALENARSKRLRMEQDSAQVGAVKSEIQGILASDLPYQDKQSQIAQMQLNYVDNTDPSIQNAFKIAASAIQPPESVSAATMTQAGMYGVPPEVAASGNPYLIGRYIGEAKMQQEQEELGLSLAAAGEKEKQEQMIRMENDLLKSELDFAETEDGEKSQWLEPDSTAKVGLMVSAYGTPEEKEVFEATRNADSDMRRMELFYKIKSRVMLDRLDKTSSGKGDWMKAMGLNP